MTPEERSELEDFGARLMGMATGLSEEHEGMRRAIGAVILQTEIQVRCCQRAEYAKECREIADSFKAEAGISLNAESVKDCPRDPILVARAIVEATHS